MFHNWANQYITMHVTIFEGIKDDRNVNSVTLIKKVVPYFLTYQLTYLVISVKLAGNVHNMKPGCHNEYRQSGVKTS